MRQELVDMVITYDLFPLYMVCVQDDADGSTMFNCHTNTILQGRVDNWWQHIGQCGSSIIFAQPDKDCSRGFEMGISSDTYAMS